MNQTTFFHKLSRWARVLKYPVLLLVIAGAIWYVRTRPIPVTSHKVTVGPVVRSVMGTGTLEARVRTTISPKIQGRIAEVLVDQGSHVKAGDVLVRLDDEDLNQQVHMAAAVIGTSEATLGRFRAEIAQAQSIFVKAKVDLRRNQQLIDANSISQAELDQTQESFELAKSGSLKAEANLLEAEQQVALNRETLKFQEARLADSKLLAPFDGLVIERQRDAGAIVVPGSPILQLISLDELWVSAWVDETEMDQLQDEQPAQIIFRSQPNTPFDGTVARLGKQSDRETREFTVDVRALKLPNTWAIGQRAEVYIETDRVDDCLRLPASYLTQQEGEVGVFIETNGLAKWRPLKLGIEGREATQVLEGLTAGELVLQPVQPTTQLSDGRKVQLP